MKKILSLVFALLFLISCGSNKDELNIYTWISFIPDEIVQNFEKETGIKVNISYYDSNDSMLAKLLSGTSEYDIISPSTDFVPILINSDLLEKLDKTKLGNTFDNLEPELNLLELSKTYDDGLNYTIPYMMLATGITVNKKYVKEPYTRDLEIFNDERFKGRMSMLDDPNEVIRMTLLHLGYKSDSENPEELEDVKNHIIEWKKNLAKFDSSTFPKSVAEGELYIVHGYPDVYYEISPDEEENFDFFLPTGALSYIDSMAITKNGEHKDNAYKFLEYLYRPDNYLIFLNKFRTIGIIKGLEDKRTSKPILTVKEVMEKATLPAQLSETSKKLQDKIWTEIKLAK